MGFIHSQEGPVNTAQHSLKQKTKQNEPPGQKETHKDLQVLIISVRNTITKVARKQGFFRLKG